MAKFDQSLFGEEAVEKKLKELSFKYLESLDNILSFNTLMKELTIQHGMTQKGRESQMSKLKSLLVVFSDLAPKYDFFSEIAGNAVEKLEETTETDDGETITVRLDILDRDMLSAKIANLKAILVECEAFAFSYPTIKAHNTDSETDTANIIRLDKENEANDVTAKNVQDKIVLFTKWLDEIDGKTERADGAEA